MLDRIKRQLTYRIPLEIMSQTTTIQNMIAKEAINVNGQCSINYESLHMAGETRSLMVLTMIVDGDIQYGRVRKAMEHAIALTLSIYSPSTEIIQVTDEDVVTRDFSVKEIL